MTFIVVFCVAGLIGFACGAALTWPDRRAPSLPLRPGARFRFHGAEVTVLHLSYDDPFWIVHWDDGRMVHRTSRRQFMRWGKVIVKYEPAA